jgi:hypothetical protein
MGECKQILKRNLDFSLTVGDAYRSMYRKIRTAWSPGTSIEEYQAGVLSAYSSIHDRIFHMLYVAFKINNFT